MCQNCGCGVAGGYAIDGVQVRPGPTPPGGSRVPARRAPAHAHPHGPGRDHDHDHDHPHDHDHDPPRDGSHDIPHGHGHARPDGGEAGLRTLSVREAVLSKNDRLAERNRGFFRAKGLLVLNLLSSPGSGKTALLERTVRDLGGRLPIGVVVGDLETDHDARRLREAGAPAVQVTTGDVCHLDAEMVSRAAERLDLDRLRLLFIENVGNLVCPASYDLGETLRVVLMSVTEGEDKPLKYPLMFRAADAILVTKMDLAGAVEFDRERAVAALRRVSPAAEVLEVSARTGQGMASWHAFLERRLPVG